MFFIPPSRKSSRSYEPDSNGADEPAESAQKKARLFRASDDSGGYYPKRVAKACDRCRLRKVKCSGGSICERCVVDAVVCVKSSDLTNDPTPINPARMRLAESQRDRLVQILFKIMQRQDENEAANTQEILTSMGLPVQRIPQARDTASPAVDLDDTRFGEVPQDVWQQLHEEFSDDDRAWLSSLYAENPGSSTEFSTDGVSDLGPLLFFQTPTSLEPLQ